MQLFPQLQTAVPVAKARAMDGEWLLRANPLHVLSGAHRFPQEARYGGHQYDPIMPKINDVTNTYKYECGKLLNDFTW